MVPFVQRTHFQVPQYSHIWTVLNWCHLWHHYALHVCSKCRYVAVALHLKVDYVDTLNHYAIDVIMSSRSCKFLAHWFHLLSASPFKPVQVGDHCMAGLSVSSRLFLGWFVLIINGWNLKSWHRLLSSYFIAYFALTTRHRSREQ
jgi:hypothetical protein